MGEDPIAVEEGKDLGVGLHVSSCVMIFTTSALSLDTCLVSAARDRHRAPFASLRLRPGPLRPALPCPRLVARLHALGGCGSMPHCRWPPVSPSMASLLTSPYSSTYKHDGGVTTDSSRCTPLIRSQDQINYY